MRKIFVTLLALVAVPLLARPASAVDVRAAAYNAWIQSNVNIGLENRWIAKQNASFRDARPVPAGFGRWEVSLPVFKLQVHLEGARRIDRDFPWEARAGVSYRLK